jgi:hypothetical protein
MFERFHPLLVFWANYYKGRGRECASLESSTRIPAADWWEISGILLGEGPLSVTQFIQSHWQ